MCIWITLSIVVYCVYFMFIHEWLSGILYYNYKNSSGGSLLKNLIEKLKQQNPKDWSAWDFKGGYRKTPGSGRVYSMNLDNFHIELVFCCEFSKYGDRFNYYRLYIIEGDKEIEDLYGIRVEKLYKKIDPQVRKYRKSPQETEQEQEVARKREEEKSSQESLEKFEKHLRYKKPPHGKRLK